VVLPLTTGLIIQNAFDQSTEERAITKRMTEESSGLHLGIAWFLLWGEYPTIAPG
jgi:hypothetical protein